MLYNFQGKINASKKKLKRYNRDLSVACSIARSCLQPSMSDTGSLGVQTANSRFVVSLRHRDINTLRLLPSQVKTNVVLKSVPGDVDLDQTSGEESDNDLPLTKWESAFFRDEIDEDTRPSVSQVC